MILNLWSRSWKGTNTSYQCSLLRILEINKIHISNRLYEDKPSSQQPSQDNITSSHETNQATMPAKMPEGSVYRTETAYITGIPPREAQRTVRIYQPARSAMQSGTFNTRYWKLRFEPQETWENPLMGWISSADANQALQLNFDSKEAAIRFAEKNGWKWVVFEPHLPFLKRKSYGENFRYEPTRLRLIRTK
jgi:NADH dehydrogenase (ubiquinone) Fe-S protein 4